MNIFGQKTRLLFDGAMGTYFKTLYPQYAPSVELANLQLPDAVKTIHRAYIDAGADVILTNTFAANTAILPGGLEGVLSVVDSAYRLAMEASNGGRDALVAADIGPIPVEEPLPEYIAILDRFLSLGARLFVLETQFSARFLPTLARHIKQSAPDTYILCSFAVSPDGFSSTERSARSLLAAADACDEIDAMGLNCLCSPSQLLQIVKTLPPFKKPLCLMPNAHAPVQLSGRTYFSLDPAYFAEQMERLAAYAPMLGGCCGTTPDCIRETAARIRTLPPFQKPVLAANESGTAKAISSNLILQKLQKSREGSGERVIAVELDPPSNADISTFLRGAKTLWTAGADAITIADCPIARVRADASMLAAKLRRELDVDVIPHMTCRDRNLNAAKALLLGLGIEGVENVLVVTGDPISTEDRNVKGVFNFNSKRLARYITELNEQTGKPISVYGALNVNAVNFPAELERAKEKEEAGITAFFTQPVFSQTAIENLETASRTLTAHLLAGIMPIVSYKNAQFLRNEVHGMDVPEALARQYEGLDRDEAQALAVRLSLQTAQATRPYCSGFYLMTPFGRVGLMKQLITSLRKTEQAIKNQ